MDNLDEFLKGDDVEPTAEVETEAVAQLEEPTPAERPRGPDGKFIAKGEVAETPQEVVPPATEEASSIPESALIGERRRRQEAEARLQEMQQHLQQIQRPQFEAPQGAPDLFEDPEGYTRWVQQQAATQAAEVARREAYETFQYQRIAQSAGQFAQAAPDYAEKVQVFQQMAQSNPVLLQELYRSNNPAEFAYNTAKTQIEISQYGGLEKLIEARVADALKAKDATPASPDQPVPDTLADAQSARGSSTEAFVPKPLEDILGKAFR
jgi:hypothetical protein